MHQHCGVVDGSVAEDSAVRGDPGDAETGADLVGYLVGQVNGKLLRHDGVLGSGAERAVGLGAVHPDTLPDAVPADAVTDGVDGAGAVAVRDDARVRHRGAEPAAALLRVAGVHAGEPHPDADLPGSRLGVGELADLQDVGRGALPLVPGCAHELLLLEVMHCRSRGAQHGRVSLCRRVRAWVESWCGSR